MRADEIVEVATHITETNSDLALLRRFEPVCRYTYGESFFPVAVDEYIKICSLWLRGPNNERTELAPAGELTVDSLATFTHAPAGYSHYLQSVAKPLDAIRYQQWRHRADRPAFHASGRLARVGLFSRLGDSMFDLSLLVRGTVPGGTSAASQQYFATMWRADPRYVYYARVLHEGGYIILHYFFFFTMNDWRSGFHGVNDHEADWEQIFVYLTDEADPQPCWVAYASHDFSGDDLRRRWDDPELHKVGTHPVVYAGAGSHASYFLPGEYLTSVEPAILRPVGRAVLLIQNFWRNTLGQGSDSATISSSAGVTRFPFIDYARGDGLHIGPGQDAEWTPILISDDVGWVDGYRGLWGLDTRDPLGGERAPSGPKYNRDGSVRMSWYNPLGWAGLDKVVPPHRMVGELETKLAQLDREIRDLERELAQTQLAVRSLTLEVTALDRSEYSAPLVKGRQSESTKAQATLQGLYARRETLREAREACATYLDCVRQGDLGPPQAHIRHKHEPAPPISAHHRAAEIWSAISGGVLLLLLVALLVFTPGSWLTWVVLLGVIFFGIEAAVRGGLGSYLLNLAIILALINTVVLLYEFWWLILIALLVAFVVFILRENLGELWSGVKTGKASAPDRDPVDGQ